MDLVVDIFTRLKAGQLSIPTLWTRERQRQRELKPWLRGCTQDSIRQAFKSLEEFRPEALAFPVGSRKDRYRIAEPAGTSMTSAALLFQLLEPRYNDTKRALQGEGRHRASQETVPDELEEERSGDHTGCCDNLSLRQTDGHRDLQEANRLNRTCERRHSRQILQAYRGNIVARRIERLPPRQLKSAVR